MAKAVEPGDEYEALAPFYRPMMQARDHFSKQARLIDEIMTRWSLPKSARLLDAACGTGDALAHLHRLGYTDLEGIDASGSLLAQAKALLGESNIALTKCRWQQIDGFFATSGRFDFIGALGNALTHATRGALPAIIRKFSAGLASGGCLVLDTRDWHVDPRNGQLREPERLVDAWRWQPSVKIDGREWWVEDRCTYSNRRQRIDYRFRQRSEHGLGWDHEVRTSAQLTPFTASELVSWMIAAGLHSAEILLSPHSRYLVVVARKP